MKKYLLIATALVALASCSDDTFVGENSPNTNDTYGGDIKFGLTMQNQTRGDIYGSAAADLLGKNFYVMGTKGNLDAIEPETSPTTNLVFDNYLVHYGVNTAGTTESNTANWEYVGVQPEATGYTDYKYLTSASRATAPQTIKYWDYSTKQYDFLAFSTGTYKAGAAGNESTKTIGVTNMAYGASLASEAVAYTFDVPSVEALQNTYITDITKVLKTNFGKEVQLQFKNLGSKVRIALYETVPGYAVKDVNFYQIDGTNEFTDANKNTTAKLISANTYGFPQNATIKVYFPHVGDNNKGEQDYDKASATVTPVTGSSQKWQTFGTLHNFASSYEGNLTSGSYLGRDLPNATFAGLEEAKYYQTVFPVSDPSAITLRVNYTLLSTDGSGEEIHIYGAKAVVPATYTKWLPNYAYTYIFKISDNTNGWTDPSGAEPAGLFPITFDAVVTEATDVTGEQTTITTVSTPTITTYQQNHNPNKDGKYTPANEYDNDGKDLYVQVMDNNLSPAVLVGTGSSTLPLLNAEKDATPKYHASLLYEVSDANATEAMVMDALENRDATIGDYNTNVTGRNGITLTYNSKINNAVTKIKNGVDDNEITVTAGQAAEIAISSLTAGTYAYVYDYSWKSTSGAWSTSTTYPGKSEVEVYEPVITASTIGSKDKYYSIATTKLDGVTPSTDVVTVDNAHLYFSKTTNGSGTTTYSYISVVNKIGTTLPKGVIVVAKSDTSIISVVNGTSAPVANTFYFDKFFSNNGKYAVKVFKVVN